MYDYDALYSWLDLCFRRTAQLTVRGISAWSELTLTQKTRFVSGGHYRSNYPGEDYAFLGTRPKEKSARSCEFLQPS